jgi:ferric-dicitrate binding protein FerR (iron transport regulator)
MPANIAPVTPELFADFKGGKESALEQLFRANFEALTQEANEKMQDMAGAQKVAASALMDAWDRRAKLENPAALEQFLHNAIGGEAAHELRRRAAAHHMTDSHGAGHAAPQVETADQWWAKIQGVLHSAQGDPAEIARRRAEASRHEAAKHLQKVAAPKRTGFYVVLVLVIAVLAGVPLWYFNKGAESTKAGAILNRDDAHVMHTKDGQRGAVMLEDSTNVKLGSNTTVKYTKSFPLDARAIELIGSADIKAPKGSSPLLVKMGTLWIYVSDAEFIGRNFPEDSGSVMLKVVAGTITVKSGQEQKEFKEGTTTLILKNGTFMDLAPDRAQLAFDWVSGNFVAEHQPLRKVLSEMKRWYGIEITTKDTSFLDRPVSMTASLDSSKTAIAALEEGGAVKITLTAEGHATLVDNAANAAKAAKATKKRK